MKKKPILSITALTILLILTYLIIGNPIVAYHNYKLKQSITSIHGKDSVTLNEVVPFEWDIVYTFAPYTSQKEIEEIIGFTSNSIQETVSEGMVQLLFIKDQTVTASICGYADNLGYAVSFSHSVTPEENAIFTVDTASGIVTLTQR